MATASVDTELAIVAKLVDEASGPLAKLRASLEGVGNVDIGDLRGFQGISTGAQQAARAIEEIATQSSPALLAVSQSAQRAEASLVEAERAAAPLQAAIAAVGKEAEQAAPKLKGISLEGLAEQASKAQDEADALLARLDDAGSTRIERERAQAAASVAAINARVQALSLEGAQVDKLKASADRFAKDIQVRIDTRSIQEALDLQVRLTQTDTARLVKLRELAKLRGDGIAVAQLDRQIAEAHGRTIDATAARQVAALREQFRGRADLQRQLDQAERNLRSQAEIEKDIARTARLRASAGQRGGAGQAFADRLRGPSSEIRETGAAAEVAEAAVGSLLGRFGGFARAAGPIGITVGAVVGLGTALNDAIDKARSLERTLEGIQVRDATFNSATIDALKASIVSLSGEYGIAREEAERLYKAAGSVGVASEDIPRFAEQGARAVLLNFQSGEETLRRLDAILDGFKRKSSDAKEVLDLIFAASQVSGENPQELAAALATVSQEATSLGVPLKEALAVLVAITEQGIPATEAGNSFASILQRISRESDPATQKLRALGVEVSASAIQTRGFIAVAKDINAALSETNPVIQRSGRDVADLRAEILGTGRAAQSAFAIFGDGAGSAAEITDQLEASANAADAAVARVLNNTGRKVDRLTQNFKNGFTGVFDGLAKAALETAAAPVPDLEVPVQLDSSAVAKDLEAIRGQLKSANLEEAILSAEKLQASVAAEVIGPDGAITNLREGAGASFDAVTLLNRELQKTGGVLREVGGEMKQVAGFSRAAADAPITIEFKTPEIRKDIQKELEQLPADVAKVLGAIPPQFVTIEPRIDGNRFDKAVETLKRLGSVPELLRDSTQQQEYAAALDSVLQRTAAQLELEKLISQTRTRGLDGLERQRQQNREIEGQLERQIRLLEEQGAAAETVSAARVELVRLQGSNRSDEADAARKEFDTRIEKWREVLRLAARQRVEANRAARESAEAVSEALASLGDDIVEPVEAARVALQERVNEAAGKIINAFIRAPIFDPAGLLKSLGVLQERAERLKQALRVDQAREFLDETRERLITIRDEQVGLLDPTIQGLARIQVDLARTQAEIVRSTPEGSDRDLRLDVQRELARLRTEDLAVEFALRPRIDFQEESLRSKLREGLAFEVDKVRVAMADLFAAKDFDPAKVRALFDDLEARARSLGDALRLEASFGNGAALADAQRALENLSTGDTAVEFAASLRFEIDEKEIRDTIRERLRPEIEKAHAEIKQLLEAGDINPGILQKILDDLAKRFARVNQEIRSERGRFKDGFQKGIESSVEELQNEAANGFNFARDAIDSITDSTSELIFQLGQGKASFKDFANAILNDIGRLLSRDIARSILGNIFGTFLEDGGVVPGQMSAPVQFAQGGVMPGQMVPVRAFEKGGVMPGRMTGVNEVLRTFASGGIMPGGMIPLRQYASGGVATSPQMALFAERPGMAEAFVPLPGVGRGIPVEFKEGQGARSGAAPVSVTIQLSAIDTQSGAEFLAKNGRQIADQIASQIADGSHGPLRASVRGAR